MRALGLFALILIAPSAVGAGASLPTSPDQLQALFAGGVARPVPAGAYRGRVVWVDDAPLPRVRARTQNMLWKGKHFHGNDTFINRFPLGFEALTAAGQLEPSWHDGQPAYVLSYAPGTPLFGSNRDELREVQPGVWLGRVWNVDQPGKKGSWFYLTPLR